MTQQGAHDAATTAGAEERSALWLRLLARLPFGLLYAITAGLIIVMRYGLRWRVAIVRDNLTRCFPERSAREIDALLNAYYRQLGEVAAEFFKLPSLSADALRSHIQYINFESVRAETDAGRSVLLLAAHQCNWEWAFHGTTLGINVPTDAAYKPLHSEGADRELRKLRRRYGARLIAAKRLVREVVRRRHELHAVALMADQMPASSGGRVWLKFLGRDTAFYPGPAEIARLTGYAAFFIAMRRLERGRYVLECKPLSAAAERAEVAVFTARYARAAEEQIMAQPADWTWLHRRWKFAPPEEEAAKEAAPG